MEDELVNILGEPDIKDDLTSFLGEPDLVKKKEQSVSLEKNSLFQGVDSSSLSPLKNNISFQPSFGSPKPDQRIIDKITSDKPRTMSPITFKRQASSQPTPEQTKLLQTVKDKYYKTEPTPQEREDLFYNDLEVLSNSIQEGGFIKDDNIITDEIQKLANKYALIYDKETKNLTQHPEIVNEYVRRLQQESPEEDKSFLEAVGNKLAAGGIGLKKLPIDVLAITEKATNAVLNKAGVRAEGNVWQNLSEKNQEIQDYLSEAGSIYDKGITESLQDGDVKTAIGQTALNIVESLPYLILPVGFGIGGKLWMGASLMGTQKGTDVYMRDSKNKDIPESSKIINAVTQGLSEYGGELFGSGAIARSLNNAIKREGTEAVKDYLVKQLQPVVNRNIAKITKGISPAIAEGVSEFSTEVADMMVENATKGTPIDARRPMDAFIVGAVSGAAITVPAHLEIGKRQYVRDLLNRIPGDYKVETQAEVLPLMVELDVLQNKKKNTEKTFHAPIDKEIEQTQAKIYKLVRENEGINLNPDDVIVEEGDVERYAAKKETETPSIETQPEAKKAPVVEEVRPQHEINYEESIAKKSPEVLAQMPTFYGKKFSLATIKPNGDISNVYVRNEGESHKTYMSPEDAKAYEEGRMTIGFWSPTSNTFIEAPQKGKEFGQRVMQKAASLVEPAVQKTEIFTEREQPNIVEQPIVKEQVAATEPISQEPQEETITQEPVKEPQQETNGKERWMMTAKEDREYLIKEAGMEDPDKMEGYLKYQQEELFRTGHQNNVLRAIDEGLYTKAVKEGKMTHDEVINIVHEARLKLNEKIENDEKATKAKKPPLNAITNLEKELESNQKRLSRPHSKEEGKKWVDRNNQIRKELKTLREERQNAIQKQGANEMDVRQQAQDGEGMGGQDKEYERITGEATQNEPTAEEVKRTQDPEIANKLRNVAEILRSGKISKIDGFKAHTPFSLAWDGGLEVMAKSLELGADLSVAISRGLDYIKNTDWYKGLTATKQKEFDEKFIDRINLQVRADYENATKSEGPFGIKKALVSDEITEETEIERRTVEGMWRRGRDLVESKELDPDAIIQDVLKRPRPLAADEVASLVYHKVKLENNFNDIYDKMEEAREAGNIEDEDRYGIMLKGINKQIQDYERMSLQTAYEQGLAFRLRQMLSDNAFNLESQIRRYKAVNKGKIPKEALDEMTDLANKMNEVNQKLKENRRKKAKEEEKQAIENIQEDIKKQNEKKEKTSKGKPKQETTKKEPAPKEEKETPRVEDGQLILPKDIIREYVEQGYHDINEIVKAIKNDYGLEDVPDRDIRDAITNYGKTIEMSQEDIDKEVRKLKRIGKLISGMEDVIEKQQRPKRSGLQRDPLSTEERIMQKKLREAMKDLPLTEEEAANKWKSALDAIKTRLTNQISELENQIRTGERTPKRKGVEYDAEALALKEQRDALRNIIQEIDGKPEISDEQKIKMAMASAQKWEQEYTRRIKEQDFSALRPKSTTPITDDLKAARERRDIAKELYQDMLKEKGIIEKRRLEALKKRVKERIINYQDRINKKDFAPRKRAVQPKLDREAMELLIENERIKNKFEELQEKNRIANRTLPEKMLDFGEALWNLPKSMVASLDFSAPLRQGAILSAAHPTKVPGALKEMFRQWWDEKNTEKFLNHLKVNPTFDIIRKSKLYISEPNAKLNAREDLFMNNIASYIPIMGKPIKRKGKTIIPGLGIYGRSERAYSGYLNKIRVDVFMQGAQHLENLGYDYRDNPDPFIRWADFINNATGRANLGAREGAARMLNDIFFAPRLVASRFNLLLNPIKYLNMPTEVRKMALREMGSFIGMGLMVLALAKAAGADVEEDPRSADFGKIRIGDLRLDIWAGFQQPVRAITQFITGERKSTTTKAIIPLSKDVYPFSTRADVVGRFIRSKMAPVPGAIWNLAAGEDMVGKDYDYERAFVDLMAPLWLNDIKTIYQEEGLGTVVGATIPNLFGIGTQYYKPSKSKAKKTIKYE